MAVPLGSGLSQIMWHRLRLRHKPLSDMSLFDNASRDIVTGGIALLWQRRGGPLSGLAFAIGLVSLAFGPLTQNALDTRSVDGKATLPRCFTTRKGNHSTKGALFNQYYSAIYSGEYNTEPAIQNQGLQRLSTDCKTGNCTFPIYSSLAICSDVKNITSSVTPACDKSFPLPVCNYTLPNGLHTLNYAIDPDVLPGTGTALFSSSTLPTENYEAWADFAIAKFSLLSYRNPGNYTAWEGVYYWCVQAYNSTVTNSVLEETVIRSWYDPNSSANRNSNNTVNTGLVLTPPSDVWPLLGLDKSTEFVVDNNTFPLPYINSSLDSTDSSAESNIPNALKMMEFNPDGWWNMQPSFEFIASSLTHRLRYEICAEVLIEGTQHGIRTIIAVQYIWLILPCIAVAMTALFFVCVVLFHSPPTMVWKSSITATLFHGLEADARAAHEMEKVLEVEEMEKIAKNVYVRIGYIHSSSDESGQVRLQSLEGFARRSMT
ncbi:polynucleotide adenylyltransferase [Diplodia intermedia]|uniref:Polynucleotide adenylyltransferase n=1 Tax=Diplodia intermedia TaxID=856260 RepID=A0ABR3TRH6_9PEZI